MYKKRYPRRKFTRRRYKKKAGGWMNAGMKALKLARHVAGLVNAEYKDLYTNQTSFATSYNGQATSLNGAIIQGTADGQRSGDSVKIKTCTIRGSLTRNVADDIIRVILVWDKENKMTISNLLQYVGSSAAIDSPKNDDMYYDCKILVDKRYIITTSDAKKMFEIVCKINQHTKYNNATNTIENGVLRLFTYSQQAANGTLVEYVAKVTFLDN